MARNFKIPANLNASSLRDPRIVVRAIIGVLLAANLVMAVIAFRPFGGSAEDLRREESSLQDRLAALQARIAASKKLVDKVQLARQQGDTYDSNVLTDGVFDSMRPGITEKDVLRMIGPPSQTMEFPRSNTHAWEYRYMDTWGYVAEFSTTFDANGVMVSKLKRRLERNFDKR